MLIISKPSMGGRLYFSWHRFGICWAIQPVSPTSLIVRHLQDAPSPASLVPGPGSEITESRSRRLSCLASADVGLAACLRVWTLISFCKIKDYHHNIDKVQARVGQKIFTNWEKKKYKYIFCKMVYFQYLYFEKGLKSGFTMFCCCVKFCVSRKKDLSSFPNCL